MPTALCEVITRVVSSQHVWGWFVMQQSLARTRESVFYEL